MNKVSLESDTLTDVLERVERWRCTDNNDAVSPICIIVSGPSVKDGLFHAVIFHGAVEN